MGKHRPDKHASRGIIGREVNADSLKTTQEEEKFGLKRGLEFDFNLPVTADAFPVGGGSERLSANFKRGRFVSSTADLFKFVGESTNEHKHSRHFQFFLHVEQVKQLQFTESNK